MALHFRDSEIMQKYICPEIFCGTAGEVFCGTLITAIVFLVVSFFSGLSVFGQPLSLILLVCLGVECGCSASLIYAEQGVSGITDILIMHLPKTAILTAVGILSAREGIRTSTELFRSMTFSAEPPCLRKYCIRYLVLTAAVLLFSALEALVFYLF